MSKISVIIPCYNAEKYIKKCFEGLEKQTFREFDVIVVDDFSTDQRLFKFVCLEKNVGLGLALAEGIKNCSHELIARMDSDDISIPNRCELQLREFAKDSLLDVCGGYIKEFCDSKEKVVSIRKVPLVDSEIKEYQKRRDKKKMIYLENVEIHHLPSNVARVYGDERDVNIIANNYVVRKMCYPIFCIPILKLMLFLRMLKHEYYFNGYSKIINKMIKERYSVEYVDRMGISTMIKMLKDVGVIPCAEAMLKTENGENSTGSYPRDFLKRTQTPQGFHVGDICDLHRRALAAGITNSVASCTLMIELGEKVYFSVGSEKNIKLTTVEDIDIFKALLIAKRSDWLK